MNKPSLEDRHETVNTGKDPTVGTRKRIAHHHDRAGVLDLSNSLGAKRKVLDKMGQGDKHGEKKLKLDDEAVALGKLMAQNIKKNYMKIALQYCIRQ